MEYCRDRKIDFSKFQRPNWGWIDDCPIVNVNWQQARDFCRWAGGDLPTEAQWEKAARGADGLLFPWGNVFEDNRLQCSADGKFGSALMTSAVDAHQSGASPYGCLDMEGNVGQWCLDGYRPLVSTKHEFDPVGSVSEKPRLIRGCSWKFLNPIEIFRCSNRSHADLSTFADDIGFRLVTRF